MQNKSYANEFIDLVRSKYVALSGKDNLSFESICWQENISPLEDDLLKKIGSLGWKSFRKFFVEYAGDALCYQPSTEGDGFYEAVHDSITESLKRLSTLGTNTPLCVISHSLGTIVASNYIWDHQHRLKYTDPKVEHILSNLKLLYTMGSPLAVWSMRFPYGGVPISLDGSWFNLYSSKDIISSPIKIINQQYKDMSNLYDIEMKVGGLLDGWNPLSHNAYWKSDKVVTHIANNLCKIGETND